MIKNKWIRLILTPFRHPGGQTSLVLFWWSLWVILFRPFDISPAYVELARMGPEWAWGTALALASLTRLVTFTYAYFYSPKSTWFIRSEIISSAVVVSAFFFIWLKFLQSSFASTAVPVYFGLFAYAFIDFADVIHLFNGDNGAGKKKHAQKCRIERLTRYDRDLDTLRRAIFSDPTVSRFYQRNAPKSTTPLGAKTPAE